MSAAKKKKAPKKAAGKVNSFKKRYERQKDLVPERVPATVIGVGAIGRQCVLQLTAMGVPLQIIDYQKVAEENLSAQGYFENDLGKFKVHATGSLCSQINSEIQVQAVASRFKKSAEVHPAIFCCVDSIETRKLIWEAVYNKARFFVDGRMSAEVMRILSVFDDRSREYYETTLFDGAEAFQESCTQKSTIFCANMAAAKMVSTYAKWLREVPLERDISINLLADEFEVVGEGGLQ